MRIYLACTARGDRGGVRAGRAICERLQQHGHEVLTTHLLADDVDAAESRLSEEAVYRRDIDWLSSCEVLVAEASGSSYGVGFEIGYVLGRAASTGQCVVLLYDAARRHAISRLITGNRHDACTTCVHVDRGPDGLYRPTLCVWSDLIHPHLLETQHESPGDHDIVHVVLRGDDREIPRTGVDIADFASEREPSKCAHIDASSKLQGARIGVALTRIGAAVDTLLRFGIPSVAPTR
jgi:hypothetical protein